ncbi:phosphatidate phosphatase LPIN3 isoform X2 [Agrilus planipennis]|uniref:phosphatidate phosphatase n=1 Tax=Agrilus planipennis TaxID=224129 RepID=A0A7F5RBK0_AGRPL|nr:phosphatidate phosphatase LPIN3 isoform X2 [Agrilus planipennis]
MHGMTYIGKVISNFKDFYNDINGATLTGAIDVVVVEQPDGTYTCSPFHVRFGKIGVLRSKEKIVDIEINGEPVDIHMKLGESGEAFFVEEVLDSDTDEIPDHLATSPIPESELEKVYKAKSLRRNSSDLGYQAPKIYENEVNDYTRRRFTADNGAIQTTRELEFIKRQINLGNIELKNSAEDVTISLQASKLSCENLNKNTNTSETIFRMDSLDMEEIHSVTAPKITNVPPVPVVSKTPEKPEITTTDNKSSRKKRRKKASIKKKHSNIKPSNTSCDTSREGDTIQDGTGTGTGTGTDGKTYDSTTDRSSLDSNISEPELKDVDEGSFTKSLKAESEPESVNHSSRKLLDPDFHFFSDTELTTGINDSRPLSPVNVESVLSDTEFEVKNRKDDDKDNEGQSWGWGEFPSSKIPTSSPLTDEHTKSQHQSMLSSVFSFMKHQRKSSNNDGIYLADLSSGSIKPEVAALYLSDVGTSKKPTDADMDCESGNGPSLPQSPNSGEQCKSIDSDYEDQSKGEKNFLDDVSISLCGWDPEPTEDQFIKYLVPFSDLCNNPQLLESPKIVIRIQNKYLNWKVAAPILVTYFIYRRPLPQSTIDQLCGLHMPSSHQHEEQSQQSLEKEKQSKQEQQQSGYSWWSWRRSRKSRETTPSLENTINTVIEGEASKIMGSKDECVETVKETYMEDLKDSEKDDVKSEDNKTLDSHSSKSEKFDKCRKTLRLSSEQIKKLNLRDDLNEIVFSVTTAYQGTTRCMCHLYKWKWDDKIVVSDIDGTITKSDVLGHILPIVGKDWAQSGVAQLFNKIKNNGYKLMYLSARAIGQARITRDYLRSICQDDNFMPDGPVLLNPTSLLTAFHREVIEKKPEQFKIACMSDIRQLFPSDADPFYAGYGNKINDVWAYRAVGIPIVRIFTINPKGELRHELTQTFQSSYSGQSLIVNEVFPPIKDKI